MKDEYTVRPATLDSLADIHGLLPDPQEREHRTADTLQCIQNGTATPDQYLILRSERGVEGVAFIDPVEQMPIIAHSRTDAPAEGLALWFSELRTVAPGRNLLLDSTLTAAAPETALSAGWTWAAGPHVMYETDLHARTYRTFEDVQEVDPESPKIRRLLAGLGQLDWHAAQDWQLLSLRSAGTPVALIGFGPSSRAGWANMNMLGVLPSRRGRGYGQRLHEHALALAARTYEHHAGGTEEANQAMRRIFVRNGSTLVARHLYFRQP